MEVETEGQQKEEDKTKLIRRGKGMKCKYEENAIKKKKEDSKKACKRKVQAYKIKWMEQKVKKEVPLKTATA